MNELEQYESKRFSQNGEDGVIAEIFKRIGTTNKFCVDLGAYNAVESSNVAALIEDGWEGILIDGSAISANPLIEVKNHFITAENVNDLLENYDCPTIFDFLSIDLDGNDYWVWKALTYRPRVLVIEYNGHFEAATSTTIQYDAKFEFKWTDYFGATLSALEKLGKQNGYRLVYADKSGCNAFFVLNAYSSKFENKSAEELWHPLFYGPYTKDEREMITI